MREMGWVLVIAGGVALVMGVLLVVLGRIPWLGRLPGDVDWTSGRTRIILPVVSMVLLSVVLTVVVNVILRLLRR
jgi:hypothetical protein